MQVTDLLAPLAARWGQRVREELDVVPHPFDSPRRSIAGPDPDRVLVLGNGPAIGFGVLSQELALPGHLARRIADATRRGVTVDVLARRGTTAALAPRLIDGTRMAHYDAGVVCIGSSDAYNLLSDDRFRRDLGQLVDTLRAATTPSTVIAVLPIHPLQRPDAAQGRAGRIVEAHAIGLDRVAADVCARRAGVVHLTAAGDLETAPRTAGAYDDLAGRIAPVLVQQLDALAAKPGSASARSLRSHADPEPERQDALERTHLARSGSNPRLDRLLRGAKDLFGTTGAAVTLVDGDRVVMKAAIGMPARDVARSVAPCDRTIRRNGALVLGDLQGEKLAEDGWRFYAGHPLESPDGYRIGALCLLDTRPHEPLTVDRIALAEMAARIESELWAEIGSPAVHASA
jgi:hypothetical protein